MSSPLLKKIIVRGVFLLAVAGGIGWVVFHPKPVKPTQSRHSSSGAPIPVGTQVVIKGEVPISVRALGTVTPLATVTVKTQIAGQLQQVAFTEGQMVKKGDFLAQIDARPYQAQLDQYIGQLARDQALLKDAEIDLRRYKVLVAEDSIASQQLDTQVSLVDQYRGTVETDKAQIASARLNVAYCHIVSPVTGRVGLRQVDQGNYVQTSDANGLVVITQLQPITVEFAVPEDAIPAIIKRVHAGGPIPVTAYDRAGTTVLAQGTLLTMDNQIDTTTGTVKLKALFKNEDEMLFPNQFVNVDLLLDVAKDQLVVSSAAVLHGGSGAFVYLVHDNNTVSVQDVTSGAAAGDLIAISSGLKEGDVVVVDGTDKLRDGAKIIPPAAKPANGNSGDAKPAEGGSESGGDGADKHHGHQHHKDAETGGDTSKDGASKP